MDTRLIARVLLMRRELRKHEAWSRAELAAHRAARLDALRRYALERSPFYRRFHEGLEGRPLEELPILTKSALMEHFDEVVTDRRIHLADVQAQLALLQGDELFLGRYRVTRTSGSTGHPGIFLADSREWASIIASYSRAQEWAGIEAGLTNRTRLAVVSSRTPWHQSARVGTSIDSPIIPVRRFDATEPLESTIQGLNAWQPENLIAYASMARTLADEQLAGRLRIAPRAVMSASELLTAETRERVRAAWGAVPFDVYAATETAGIASECAHHRKHLFEDLVITEIVDEKNRPVPAGHTGAKILVTVLFSRTQPLIRYEMSDRIAASTSVCDCGLPFALLAEVEGRQEDVLVLPAAAGGTVAIHPNVFHDVLEPLPVGAWQVVEEQDGLRVLLAKAPLDLEVTRVAERVASALEARGALRRSLVIERVERVEKTALGKSPLVRALRRPKLDPPPRLGERESP